MSRPRGGEPEAVFLGGVRRSLTLWYTIVLAVTLVVLGAGLYFGQQNQLMRPIRGMVTATADFIAYDWQQAPARPCEPPAEDHAPALRSRLPVPFRSAGPPMLYIACLDAEGKVLALGRGPGDTTEPPEPFLSTTLVGPALRQGTAEDIVDGGEAGPVFRLAKVVPGLAGSGTLGVVMVGRSIAEPTSGLTLLRFLLLLVGGLAVVIAAVGGLFLANRALAPAHLAFARQQAFISDASHELRTPLTLIRANAEVLLRNRDKLEPRDAALVDDIVGEVGHMDRLTTSLLTLARLDAAQFHLASNVVDLSSIAASAVRRLTPLAREKGLAVSEDYGGRATVLGDDEALEQVALILIENAIKYTPREGTITIRTTAEDGRRELIVTDTGVGIPAEDLPQVGRRFYRVDRARSRDAGGAGLGLAIAFRIAAVHGGEISIHSTPGHGTTASLLLRSLDHGGPRS